MTEMLQDMQTKAQQMEQQLASTEFTTKGGGGLVSATANGAGEITDISIDDSLLDDKGSLQILLMSTINDLIATIEQNKKSQALGMMGGINPFGGSTT